MARWRGSKRPEFTPRIARGYGWTFAVIATLATAGLFWLTAVYSHQRSELAAFNSAPLCTASQTAGGTTSCRSVQTAVVADTSFAGGGKGGSLTEVYLSPDAGPPAMARVNGWWRLRSGQPVTLTSWHGKIDLIQTATPGSAPVGTLAGPQWGVGNDATGILVLSAFALGLGTSAWGFLTYFRIGRRRALPVHLVAAALFATVVVLRVRGDFGALTTAGYAAPPLFLAALVGSAAPLVARSGTDDLG